MANSLRLLSGGASLAQTITPSPQTIGNRIQRIRQRQGLSVRDLAERSTVNKNTILRLERGLTPSYATLTRVCEALGIHVARLTDPAPDEEEVIALHMRADEARLPHRAPDATVRRQDADTRQILASDEKVFLSLLNCRLPGGTLNSAILELFGETETVTHPGEELVFCLRGVAMINVAGRQHVLHEGDAAAFWCSERHSYGPAEEAAEAGALPVLLLSVWTDPTVERQSRTAPAPGARREANS